MIIFTVSSIVFFKAEDGIRDLVRSRGLGDVYKRQAQPGPRASTSKQRRTCAGSSRSTPGSKGWSARGYWAWGSPSPAARGSPCLLYTSDAADERSSVDLGGRRIIKTKKTEKKKKHKQ